MKRFGAAIFQKRINGYFKINVKYKTPKKFRSFKTNSNKSKISILLVLFLLVR